MNERPSLLACTLGEPELILRRMTVLREIRSATKETRELDNGFAFRLPLSDEWGKLLEEFIAFERRCCAFLSIDIEAQPGDDTCWLRVSGPEGTKEFVRTELLLVE